MSDAQLFFKNNDVYIGKWLSVTQIVGVCEFWGAFGWSIYDRASAVPNLGWPMGCPLLRKTTMTKWQVWGWCCLAAAAVTLQGCAAFRGEKLPKVDAAQLEVAQGPNKLKVFARWTSDALVDPVPDKALQAGAELSKKSFEDAIAASHCCTFVDQEAQA
ncbi:MAG: hypothetical protein KGI52_08670, partial [Burkholderiales bacterium]|nr:hypothetical protein [Burkholderiales bacterium]